MNYASMFLLELLILMPMAGAADDGLDRSGGLESNEAVNDAASAERVIQRGISTGQLSPVEVRELRAKVSRLQQNEAKYAADGRLSDTEREKLRDEYGSLREALRHEMHDGERRQRYRGRYPGPRYGGNRW